MPSGTGTRCEKCRTIHRSGSPGMVAGFAVDRTRGFDRVVAGWVPRQHRIGIDIVWRFSAVGRLRCRLHTASRIIACGHAGAAEDVHGWVDVSTNNLLSWSRAGRLSAPWRMLYSLHTDRVHDNTLLIHGHHSPYRPGSPAGNEGSWLQPQRWHGSPLSSFRSESPFALSCVVPVHDCELIHLLVPVR
jgi:hypothetical protein